MTDRYLYVLALPSDSQTRTESRLRQQLAKLGAITGGQGAVESISTDPGEQILQGQYRGQYADKMATEVEELFDNKEMGPVVYRGSSSGAPEDGYYALENVTVGRVDPREDRLQDFDGRLTKEGTRASQWRATETTPSGSQNNDFGNDTTAYVGIPAAANKIRWYNSETGAREQPTLVETRNAEHGDVEIYDADASSYSNPTAIYELPYANEGEVDVRVWDDRGAGLANKTDANGVLQWQKVFAPAHAFGDLAVVDTGLLRLVFDESNQSMQAQQWDDANTTWTSVSLGTSDWQLFDLDIRRITAAVVEARVEFEDPTTSPNSYYTLTMLAHRGYKAAQWFFPDGKGPTPSKLVTKLDPVANESVVDPQPEKGLVARDEVQP